MGRKPNEKKKYTRETWSRTEQNMEKESTERKRAWSTKTKHKPLQQQFRKLFFKLLFKPWFLEKHSLEKKQKQTEKLGFKGVLKTDNIHGEEMSRGTERKFVEGDEISMPMPMPRK